MRVGLLCHSGIGGSVRIACTLASELAQRGHSVHVIAHRPPVADWLKDSGVFLHTLLPPANGSLPAGLKVDWSSDEQSEFRSLVASVARSERLQILHAHYAVPFAHVAASLARGLGESGPVTVATLHGTDVSIHGREPAQRRLLGESLRALAAVTTVSHDHARLARHLFALLEPPLVIPNFIDITRFKPTQSPHRDRPRVVHVSNFRGVKDPRSLAHVFLAVRERIDAELWLVGDGPSLPALREMLSEARAEDAVRFFGATTDVARILREADLLLMTSVVESFCVAAAEAMASGLPVVATRVGGVAEVVGDGTSGHLFPVGAHAPAADAVAELLARPSLRRRVGSAARRQAARFASERIVPRYERLYQDLVDRGEREDRPARAVAEDRS
jgi:N-acetyl-alpha-D-glucosaminyl L-malate synthase BshA